MHRIIAEIGPVTIYSYGLMIAFAFMFCSIFMVRDAKKFGIKGDDYFDCLLAALFGGLVGGRLLFVALNWQEYSWNILRIVMVNEGGLAIQGALVVGVAAASIACKIKKIPVWKALDIAAPYIALGQAIGRVGCFLNGCCYGVVTDSRFGVIFPGDTVKRIPAQLIFSLALVVIFLVLLFLRKHKRFDGYTFSMYLIIFGAYRVIFDFLRGDELVSFAGVNLTQLLGMLMTLSGIGLYYILKRIAVKGDDSA